jgi:hypothetical protein
MMNTNQGNLFSGATTMTTEMTERWYVRCVDCLCIGVVEQNPKGQPWKCGACEGAIETMGKVVQNHLETEHVKSACDKRCTHAIGPLCVCKCNCANHGTGRVVHVVVKSEIPVIDFKDVEGALDRAMAYRLMVAQIQAIMNAPENRNQYYYFYNTRNLLSKARDARKHDTRMKRLGLALAAVPVNAVRPVVE